MRRRRRWTVSQCMKHFSTPNKIISKCYSVFSDVQSVIAATRSHNKKMAKQEQSPRVYLNHKKLSSPTSKTWGSQKLAWQAVHTSTRLLTIGTRSCTKHKINLYSAFSRCIGSHARLTDQHARNLVYHRPCWDDIDRCPRESPCNWNWHHTPTNIDTHPSLSNTDNESSGIEEHQTKRTIRSIKNQTNCFNFFLKSSVLKKSNLPER